MGGLVHPEVGVMRAMLSVTLVLVLVDVVNGAAGIDSTALDLGGERNLSAWFTSVQFAFAAVAVGLAVTLGVARRGAWGPVAALMMAFSIDEIAMFHERIEVNIGLSTTLKAVVLASALVLVAAIAREFRGVVGHERRLALAAAGAFVAALVADALSGDALPGPLLAVLSDAEEVFEMLLGTFILAAGALMLNRTPPAARLRALDPSGEDAVRPGASAQTRASQRVLRADLTKASSLESPP